MWVFEKRGFVSVVAYDPDKDKFNPVHHKMASESEDPKGWLLIRARATEDLEQVEAITGLDIAITTDHLADYSFRGLMTREQYKGYLCTAVDEIDYGSHFKEVCRDNSSQGQVRHSAMMTVWNAMLKLQPYAPYGGGKGWSVGNWSSKGGSFKGGKKGKKGIGGMATPTTDTSYRSDDYYDTLFSDAEAAGSDWYEWGGKDTSKVTSVTVTKSSTTSYVGAKTYGTVPDFVPSTYWYEVEDLAKAFLNGMVLNDFSNDDIESMRDDAFEIWLEAGQRHAGDQILSAADIEALVGEEVFEKITATATAATD